MKKTFRIAFIANAVGLLHTGATGGVRNAIINAYIGLTKRGHHVEVLAPEGSRLPEIKCIIPIPGALQEFISIMVQPDQYQIPKNAYLANSIRHVFKKNYDFVINFSNDWLPYYMTPFFDRPLLHRMNAANENNVVSYVIQHTVRNFPNQVAVLTRAQAEDVGLTKDVFLLSQGINVAKFPFYPQCDHRNLAVIARITPEKGLEDAAEIALRSKHKLLVFGYLQDEAYFKKLMNKYHSVVDYRGFLKQEELIKELSTCRALLCTHKGPDAFPQVVLESMACGLPVISYRRSGPVDVIKHEQTGYLVEPDQVNAAVRAVEQLDQINREDCRNSVVASYSLEKLTDRYEKWLSLF